MLTPLPAMAANLPIFFFLPCFRVPSPLHSPISYSNLLTRVLSKLKTKNIWTPWYLWNTEARGSEPICCDSVTVTRCTTRRLESSFTSHSMKNFSTSFCFFFVFFFIVQFSSNFWLSPTHFFFPPLLLRSFLFTPPRIINKVFLFDISRFLVYVCH